jgi:hypothetical protein
MKHASGMGGTHDAFPICIFASVTLECKWLVVSLLFGQRLGNWRASGALFEMR